jgi:2-polyprenyl-6-methoxyphenol hydroxylase-like FAD-dependent oxidoreductase
MAQDTEPEIVVVGMGPVGMTVALRLARQGVPVTVLEAGEELSVESRASTFHPSTLQVLDELGVIEEVLEIGLKSPGFQYRGKNRELIAHLDMSVLAEDTKYPYRIQLEQSKVTRIIRRHLEKMPHVTLRLGAPVQRVEVATDKALVYLEGDGLEPSYTADWVVATDGASSICRRSLGIAFEGVTYPERFLVASTTHQFEDDFPGLAPVSYIYDPKDWGVLLRTPSHWRVLFPIDESESSEDALDPDRVEERLQSVVPLPERYPLVHRTIYAVHQRIATTFAVGRVLLAGDAAHINNPLGGMGMNSGIHDGDAAVQAINFALAGGDSGRAASVYSKVRRDVAAFDVQANTQKNYEEMREQDERSRESRKEEMAKIAADPDLTRAYLRKAGLVSSLETSRRRMARGLSPVRSARPEPAGQILSDSIRLDHMLVAGGERTQDMVYLSADQVPSGDRELAEMIADSPLLTVAEPRVDFGDDEGFAQEIRALERCGVAAVHLVSRGDISQISNAVSRARGERWDMLVFVSLRQEDLDQTSAEELKALVADGVDALGVIGVEDRNALFSLRQDAGEVALIVHSDYPLGQANSQEWSLGGANLVLPTVAVDQSVLA